jgi:Zn-dependent M28 family amino/carboxypeptidase
MARLWASQQPRPRRSALFLATMAEENGLLGASIFAAHPAYPLGKMALNLNFDALPLAVPESNFVNGANHSLAAYPGDRRQAPCN